MRIYTHLNSKYFELFFLNKNLIKYEKIKTEKFENFSPLYEKKNRFEF